MIILGSGQIDFDEFAVVMGQQFYRKPSKAELVAAFKYFDKDNSGHITEDELFEVMSKFRGGLSPQDVKKMVKAIDKDGNGKINVDEFIALMAL